MNLLSLLGRSVREKGIVRTILVLFSHAQDLAFDFKYKTNTLSWQELSSISVVGKNKSHGVQYQPTQARTLRKVFKSINLPRSGAFLDLGCGKGKVLILAAEFGYTQIIGVEFSETLCQIARLNLLRYSKLYPGPTEFQVIHADAAEYAIPDDASTVFMFNPFDSVVMAKVVMNIEKSLRRRARKLHIVYRHPLHRELFDNSSLFQIIAQHSFPQCDFLVYAAGNG